MTLTSAFVVSDGKTLFASCKTIMLSVNQAVRTVTETVPSLNPSTRQPLNDHVSFMMKLSINAIYWTTKSGIN